MTIGLSLVFTSMQFRGDASRFTRYVKFARIQKRVFKEQIENYCVFEVNLRLH